MRRALLLPLLVGPALLLGGCFGGDDQGAQVDRSFYVASSIASANTATGTFESSGAAIDKGQAAIEFDPFGDPPTQLRGTARLTGANGTITLRFDAPLVTTSPPSLTGAASSVAIGTFVVTAATGGYTEAVGAEGRFASAIDGAAGTVRVSFGPQPTEQDEPPADEPAETAE